jgi:hypothetical protein
MTQETPAQGEADKADAAEVQRKFKEALDAKKANDTVPDEHAAHRRGPSVHGHGASGGPRQFRRKSG